MVTPGGKRTIKTAINAVLNEGDMGLVESGTFIFYVYGELTYDDVFGQLHHTIYCFKHDPGRTPGLSNCADFNDAD